MVNVNLNTMGEYQAGEEKKLKMSLTRCAYRENENILFALLNQALPQDKWAILKWNPNPVESAFPTLFAHNSISVNYEDAQKALQNITRSMLYLDDDDISMGPVPEIMQTFWIYQKK